MVSGYLFYFHRIVSLCTSNNNPGVITIEKQSLASVILLYLRFIFQGAPGKRGNPGILGEPGEKVRGCYENFCTSIIMIQPRRYSAV